MTYFREFRINWQSLLATFIGIATGSTLSNYTMSLFAPELIKEFGWSKAHFALVGSLPMITLLVVPFAGRFTDRFGARIAAVVGFIAMSAGFFAFSTMRGSIAEFFTIWVLQHIFGVLTTSLVFTRVIVERFDTARGTALSILMIGAPASGAVVAPLLGAVMTAHGWRTAFVTLAVISAIGGLICAILMGRNERHRIGKRTHNARLTRAELLALMRHRTFLLIVGGMFLINIPQVFASSQLKLIVLSNGMTDQFATWMLSLYAIGVIVGRVTFGLALDRVPAHIIAISALGLPAIGFLILAFPVGVAWLLAMGVLVIGIAQGAEGDVGAYIISRHFDLKNYSLVFSFVRAGLDGGGAIGSLILSYTLKITNSYEIFLLFSAATTIVGAICFFLTGYDRARGAPASPITTEAV